MDDIRISKEVLCLWAQAVAVKLLFFKSIREEREDYLLHPTEIVNILKMMPEIRKWQGCYILFREEKFKEGINLSSQFLRDKIKNNVSFLKEHDIAPEEVADILEEFVREFTDRIFKEKK